MNYQRQTVGLTYSIKVGRQGIDPWTTMKISVLFWWQGLLSS